MHWHSYCYLETHKYLSVPGKVDNFLPNLHDEL